jgi:hypothetical protein
MENKPVTPTAWQRFGIPALIIAFGLLWGMSGHRHGAEDWGAAIYALFIWPALLVTAALGAAFGAGTKFGTFCLRALLFIIASGLGSFGSYLWW